MQRIKALGFNGISMYTFWALHNPSPGVLDFEGVRSLDGFFEAANEAGLWVVARPGPYIVSLAISRRCNTRRRSCCLVQGRNRHWVIRKNDSKAGEKCCQTMGEGFKHESTASGQRATTDVPPVSSTRLPPTALVGADLAWAHTSIPC